jgi:hypothetical protein
MLREKTTARTAVVGTHMVGKSTRAFFEMPRRDAKLDEVRDTGCRIESGPVDEGIVIPQTLVDPNRFQMFAQRFFRVRVFC